MTNPFVTKQCGEIILRPNSFCNLSEVVIRAEDKIEDLKRKVRIAAFIGTLQSTLTDFRYLRKVWKDNVEEERLLGVSLTGIMDNQLTSNQVPGLSGTLEMLRELAIETNRSFSEVLGINSSVSITTVKPSGTVSQLVDSASGIHPRFGEFYIRTVRSDNKDPLTQFLISQGVPNEPAFGKEGITTVFSFPMKAPGHAVMRNDMTAIEQLEHYAIYQEHWCEHNPSITVYVDEHEWFEVGAWVYKNFDRIGGVSFLPRDNGSYKQAPYQEITKEEWELLSSQMPVIDWSAFKEEYDSTTSMKEYACTSGSCELV